MQLWKLETGNWLDAACEEQNGNGKLEMRWMEMWLCGEAATWETGNWKLGAHLKCISFVKNVEEAPGRFRSVDLVRYIKTGSSQCAAICVLESRNLETQKRFDFWDFTNPQTVAKADPGNPEIRKARRDHSNRGRRRHLQRRCARRRIAADAHDAPCNSRAAAVMRDVIPVTGADDAPPHVTALARSRCCGDFS